ncbi:MAG TPA: hypothetical protein VIY48_11280 [Candidatus Paceibacterota bacterium]
MERIGDHLKREKAKEKATERGELMKYFMIKLNVSRTRDGYPALTLARMGRVLQAIPTKDLYYLKSVCEQSKDFSKKFWWEIKPANHTPEAKAKAQKMWEEKEKQKRRDSLY